LQRGDGVDLPVAQDLAENPLRAQEALARPDRQLISGAEYDSVPNIEQAPSLPHSRIEEVAGGLIDLRAVVERLTQAVVRQERETRGEPFFQLHIAALITCYTVA